jgi:hypothetical protein
MVNHKYVIVITDNENSRIIRMLLRNKIIPIIRTSIISAMDILRHLDIRAIIIDKEHRNLDPIEFILNARDISADIPIFIPQKFNPQIINQLENIRIFDNEDPSIESEISQLAETDL